MNKRFLAIALILTLVLTSTAFAFADVQPRDTNFVIFDIQRVSRTTATATVDVLFSTEVDRYNVTIYLQKKVNGEWVSDTTNTDYVFYNSGQSEYDFTFNHIYSNLSGGVTYRLKCVSTDYIGNSTHTTTTYSNQF